MTAAASVEATTAPTSSPSCQDSPSAQTAAGAVSTAESKTPAVASVLAGREHAAECLQAGAQAAVEQDQRQRHRADGISHLHVIELDAARPRLPCQHADKEEDEQQRRAEPQRDQARHDAGDHQQRAEQDGKADCVKRGHANPYHALGSPMRVAATVRAAWN